MVHVRRPARPLPPLRLSPVTTRRSTFSYALPPVGTAAAPREGLGLLDRRLVRPALQLASGRPGGRPLMTSSAPSTSPCESRRVRLASERSVARLLNTVSAMTVLGVGKIGKSRPTTAVRIASCRVSADPSTARAPSGGRRPLASRESTAVRRGQRLRIIASRAVAAATIRSSDRAGASAARCAPYVARACRGGGYLHRHRREVSNPARENAPGVPPPAGANLSNGLRAVLTVWLDHAEARSSGAHAATPTGPGSAAVKAARRQHPPRTPFRADAAR